MTTKKATRRALTMSLLSLLLCVSMLVGTTFAWFTDEVVSGKNLIASGNLDIELEYSKDMTDGSWKPVKDQSDLFSETLWEPGHTEVVYLRISNLGSLALKYQLSMSFTETEGINKAGERFWLSQYLKYDVQNVTAAFADRAAARAAVENTAETLAEYAVNGAMEAGAAAKTVALVVYMPEEVGNEANHNGTDAPVIDLGIKLFATQKTSETDSFGDDYDKAAAWTGDADNDWYFSNPDAAEFTVSSAEELAGLSALVNGTAVAPTTTFAAEGAATVQDSFKGKTVYLGADIDLNDIAWTPIGDDAHPFQGTFDGKDHTVSNLKVNNLGWAGLFGHAGRGGAATIRNLKISGATIYSSRMAGTVVGQLYGDLENCHVSDVKIVVVPNAVDGGYDNGDKVGGIVGWLGDNGNGHHVTNCSVEKASLSAYRDLGGIVGYAAWSTTISGNSVRDTEIVIDQTTNFYGEKDPNAGAVWGRNSVSGSGVGVTAENNAEENVSIEMTYSKNGLTLKSDGQKVTLYLVPASLEASTVEVPEGVTHIGSYAFAYNQNVEKIVLPGTVTTLNDRAFRDTSASEVVLNEGLTNISYQAFRNATNVKSVVIPSTVTTVSKEAFQNSGITQLTVPATVTTIEYGAMRDMKELVSVVLEGNADIPVYAFRACAKLETVELKGEDVTFGGGSRGMIFTNKENGDGSAITVYVANETVKERLLAADTAAKDYGGYTIVVAGAVTTD